MVRLCSPTALDVGACCIVPCHAQQRLCCLPLFATQIRSLQGEVDRLHGLLTDMVRGNHGRATVIHTGRTGGSGWTLYAYPVAGMGLLYAYCR
eukprot:353034-Chlamydomonas_euryale.AAC.6